MFFDMKNLPNKNKINLNCGYVYNKIPVDCGGFFHYYLKDNPKLKINYCDKTFFQELLCKQCKRKKRPAPPCTHNTEILKRYGLNDISIQFAQSMPLPNSKQGRDVQFLMKGTFLHYRCGSNYLNFPHSFENIKTKLFKKYLDAIIGNNRIIIS